MHTLYPLGQILRHNITNPGPDLVQHNHVEGQLLKCETKSKIDELTNRHNYQIRDAKYGCFRNGDVNINTFSWC